MSEHDSTPPETDAIRPDTRQVTSEVPPTAVVREDGITTEPLSFSLETPVPPKPHPNFWWAVLWCIGFLLVTQVPGAVIASVILFIYAMQHPGAVQSADSLIFPSRLAEPVPVTETHTKLGSHGTTVPTSEVLAENGS